MHLLKWHTGWDELAGGKTDEFTASTHRNPGTHICRRRL
jgi:hypothetical protein